MGKEKLQARQEKTKEKFEEKARIKKEEKLEDAGIVKEKKKEEKPKPKKKVEIKKPTVVEATGRGEYLPISTKSSVEVSKAIRGKTIEKANFILDGAITLERPIRYYRFNKDTPHRKGKGFGAGRYPVKVALHLKDVLKNAVANAKYLNLDGEKLYVKGIIANRAISKEKQGKYTHMKITVAEREETKAKVKK